MEIEEWQELQVNVKEISRPNPVMEKAELSKLHNFIHFHKVLAFFQQ